MADAMQHDPTSAPPGAPPDTETPTSTTPERWSWPYLNPAGPSGMNGRECGAWILGHLVGRAVHGERGLRCVITEARKAGVVSVLIDGGATVSQVSTHKGLVTIDVWIA